MCRQLEWTASVLSNGDVGEALHCFFKCSFLLIVDVLDTSVENIRIPLNLLYDVQQSTGYIVVQLNVVHSHVVYVLVRRCDDLNDSMEESIANQSYDAW